MGSFKYTMGSFGHTMGSFGHTMGSFGHTMGSFGYTMGSFVLMRSLYSPKCTNAIVCVARGRGELRMERMGRRMNTHGINCSKHL